MLKKIKIIFVMLCITLSGCASHQGPNLIEKNPVHDPYEGWNRGVFAVNVVLDDYLLSPTAQAYNFAVPGVVKYIISNELDYIQTPVSLLNTILQGDMQAFEHVLSRFIINTTLGGLGLLDAATELGYPRHREDFAQTLAVWGVDNGPYLVAPFFGPTTLRGVGGQVVDIFSDPLTYSTGDTAMVGIIALGVGAVSFRANNYETINGLRASSEDYYATLRSIYIQQRNANIQNLNLNPKDEFIDFSAYDEEDEE
ncbi:MAG: VacJ family lipoprotein [Pseudomonadota bacterium]